MRRVGVGGASDGIASSPRWKPNYKYRIAGEGAGKRTYSAGSFRRNISIAAENAANANPPPTAALGPEFRAKIPPARKPAPTEL